MIVKESRQDTMKTRPVSLVDLMEQAIPGKMYAKFDEDFPKSHTVYIKLEREHFLIEVLPADGIHRGVYEKDSHIPTAALIVHSYNMFPKMLEKLKSILELSDDEGGFSSLGISGLRDLITEVETANVLVDRPGWEGTRT